MDFNLHPPLTAFPLALIVCIAFLQLLYLIKKSAALRNAININFILSVLATIAAFFSGYQAGDMADKTFAIDDALIAAHHSYGRLLLFTFITCAAFRLASEKAAYNRNFFSALYYITLLISLVLVIYTGYLGGNLVFVHGAGVSAQLPVTN